MPTSAPSAPRPAGAPAAEQVAALGQELVRLSRATHAMRAAIAAGQRDGVEWSAYVLLAHLVRDGAQRSSTLAETVHADPSTISRQVAQLVRLGLVERRPDPLDGRAALLVATDEGVRTFSRIRERRNRALAHLVADWSDEDVDRLTALLARFNDGYAASAADVTSILSQTESHA